MKKNADNKKKIRPQTCRLATTAAGTSLAAALLGWLLLSVLNLFVMWALRDRSRLVRDNDNERTLNTLFTEMRNYSDFGAAIDSNPVLKERINGAAIYDDNLRPIQQWGKVPPVFDEKILEERPRNRFGRYTIPDRRGRSALFVLRYERMGPRMMPAPPPQDRRMPQIDPDETRHGRGQNSLFFSSFSRGRYFYTDISHLDFWRTQTITAALFPLVEILLLFVVLYIRRLYLHNKAYREKIAAQHNLVVLGTAAGTLAHEIKNPLLSIRLQTGILEKTAGKKDELDIINQEIDRLSSLVYRVNDYLREPAGEQAPVDMRELLAETSKRICGADILRADEAAADKTDYTPVKIFADENRIRSVLENILRNALESGSPLSEIGASIKTGEGAAIIEIFDRGKGIAEKDIRRIFDPFFTSKSAGTGIGLAISKRFTEAADGNINAENRTDGGLVVTLVFPLYSDDE